MAYTERRTTANKHPWTLPQLGEMTNITRPISRPPPGNHAVKPASDTIGRVELAKRKNDFFEEVFSVRGDRNPLRERIRADSIVLVEVKTNVIIGDEFVFITELSAKLAERYQRPLASIAVHISHSQCIFYAGTFEPAYIAKVSTLAPYVQPTTNRRNAHVLSEHLEDALGVPPPRGVITFVALPEENVACDGKTMAQALDDSMEGGTSNGMGVIDEGKAASFGSRKKRLSVKSLSNIRTTLKSAGGGAGEMTPPNSAEDIPMSEDKPVKVARRRKSFMAGLFGRSSNKENEKQAAET